MYEYTNLCLKDMYIFRMIICYTMVIVRRNYKLYIYILVNLNINFEYRYCKAL